MLHDSALRIQAEDVDGDVGESLLLVVHMGEDEIPAAMDEDA